MIVHLRGAADTSFDGKFQVTACPGCTVTSPNGTFRYQQSGQANVASTPAPAGTENTYDNLVPIASYSRSSNVATITTSAVHGLNTNDDPSVYVADSSFSGTFNITKVSTTMFRYPNPARTSPNGRRGRRRHGEGHAGRR